MIRGRISSNPSDLNELNAIYPWIPNAQTIRPNAELVERKKILSQQIQSEWYSYRDYIMNMVWNTGWTTCKESGKKIALIQENLCEWSFQPSQFRYGLVPESNHWILWNLHYDILYDYDDLYINKLLEKFIIDVIGNPDKNFDFAWYKNPKPTIPEFYHIQVFWRIF